MSHSVIARAQAEAIQEVPEPDLRASAWAVNFLDRHGDLAVASR
jgi:hypothetical protein